MKLVSIVALLIISIVQADPRTKREELYRLNNLGVALMEQYKHEDATREFKKIIASDPAFTTAHINLALAYYFLNDSRNALAESREALKLVPASPHANYVLGATLKKDRDYQNALKAFARVLETDPGEPTTNIQIGQVYSQLQQYEPAIAAFKRALDAEPYNATAAYSLAQALNRSGKSTEGRQMLDVFQKLRASGYATSLGLNYGEQGRYAEAVTSTGVEPDLVSPEAPAIRFIDPQNLTAASQPGVGSALGKRVSKSDFDNDAIRRTLVAPFARSINPGDFNGDDRLDFLVTGTDSDGKGFIRLLRNDGRSFTDVTNESKVAEGLSADELPCGAVFGDYDNDLKTDILVFGYRSLRLLHNNGDGTFKRVTALPVSDRWALTAAMVDVDHDGDLDLFVGNFADMKTWPGGEAVVFPDDFKGEANRLYRNNGNGTFTDISNEAGVAKTANKTTAAVATDFNNLRDIDLIVANYNGPIEAFSNQRDGSFKDVAAQIGLAWSGKALGLGAGDLNKDGFVDLYIPARGDKDALMLSDGRGKYVKQDIASQATVAAQMADYDNDGLLDVISLGSGGIDLRRGLGASLAAPVHVSIALADSRALALGDVTNDGATDMAAFANEGLARVWTGQGASKNFVKIKLQGKTSNRSAIGTKLEVRSGSLAQKLEVYSSSPPVAQAGATFGLGYRTAVDALRLLWPSGILQSEVSVKTGELNSFEELDRKGTSCPLLYAWNGTNYSFVTDFLGGSAIGYLEEPGTYNYPDTDEYVRVTGDQLKAKDGLLSLRMNNQLEEVIYFDAARLLAIDHPQDTEVYPNERLMPTPPYPEFKIFSVKNARPPVAARSDSGRDILSLISRIDRSYPDDFQNLPYKGYAREHSIELDLGRIDHHRNVLLMLTAWIDYADSTSNIAASQAGVALTPPYLQVRNAQGEWQTVIQQMGFPAGLPKTMTVDLTGKFLCDDARVRIVTSMRIFWDQILVSDSVNESQTIVTSLNPVRADLRHRGFPREYSPDGKRPLIYDYSTIEADAPWKVHKGNYTRFGDVLELLNTIDDRYVITRSGDEIQVDFEEARLPKLKQGWKRDYLVFADGFGKDMDINSARPDTIGELPFHGMKSYPYSKSDHYPNSKSHRTYLEQFNTRTYQK